MKLEAYFLFLFSLNLQASEAGYYSSNSQNQNYFQQDRWYKQSIHKVKFLTQNLPKQVIGILKLRDNHHFPEVTILKIKNKKLFKTQQSFVKWTKNLMTKKIAPGQLAIRIYSSKYNHSNHRSKIYYVEYQRDHGNAPIHTGIYTYPTKKAYIVLVFESKSHQYKKYNAKILRYIATVNNQ